MTLTDAQVSRLRGALDRQLEADKDFEAKTKARPELPSPERPPTPPAVVSPPLSPSTIPPTIQDRYAKGWCDAWDSLRPQLYELHRQTILAETLVRDRWLKWLPVICLCFTLFGFVLGWWCSGGMFAVSGAWDTAQ